MSNVFFTSLKVFSLLFFVFIANTTIAQDLDPVKWEVKCVKENGVKQLEFTATIEDGWYLYSQDLDEGGPIPTSFELSYEGENYEIIKPLESSKYKLVVMDEMFLMELTKYKHDVRFTYPIDESLAKGTIQAFVEFMCCDDIQCLAPKIKEFTINLK